MVGLLDIYIRVESVDETSLYMINGLVEPLGETRPAVGALPWREGSLGTAGRYAEYADVPAG